MLTFYNALFLSVLITVAHGLLKWVSTKQSGSYSQIIISYWWAIGLSVSIYMFMFVYYAYILKKVSISAIYPTYTGLSIVFVVLVGVVFFGESFSYKQVTGTVLVLAGIYLIMDMSPSV